MLIRIRAALLVFLLQAIFYLGFSSIASAQNISQTSGNIHFFNSGQGQSFTAIVTGTLTQIQIRPRTSISTTIRFYNGDSGSGVVGGIGTPVYSHSVTLVNQVSNASGLQTVTLATPLPIVAGSAYSFVLDTGSLAVSTTNPYTGGTLLLNNNGPSVGFDAVFTATELSGSPAAVPTLSEWALILLGVNLAGGAALLLQRRQTLA